MTWRGDYAGAIEAADAASVAFPPATSGWYRAHDERFLASSRRGDLAAAMSALQAITSATAVPGAEVDQLRSAARCAIVLLRFGAPDIGRRLAARVEQLAAPLALEGRRGALIDVATEERVHALRAVVARNRGDIETALAEGNLALRACDLMHDDRERAFAYLGLGGVYQDVGADAEAVAELDRGVALAERLGGGTVASLLYVSRAWSHAQLGDHAAATADCERAIAATDAAASGVAHLVLARFELVRGDLAAARARADRALALLPAAAQFHAVGLATRARVHVRTGDLEAARADIAGALRIALPNEGFEDGEATIRLAHAEVLAASGDDAAARDALAAAADRLLARAARIAEPWRTRFLRKRDHADTLARAGRMGAA